METEDRISGLYKNRTIFVSGATGYLGKILIEKILRCCPDVKTIYVLIRKKKGQAGGERLREIFRNPVGKPVRYLLTPLFNS